MPRVVTSGSEADDTIVDDGLGELSSSSAASSRRGSRRRASVLRQQALADVSPLAPGAGGRGMSRFAMLPHPGGDVSDDEDDAYFRFRTAEDAEKAGGATGGKDAAAGKKKGKKAGDEEDGTNGADEEEVKQKDPYPFKRLMALAKSERRAIILGLIMLLFGSLSSLGIPFLAGMILDSALTLAMANNVTFAQDSSPVAGPGVPLPGQSSAPPPPPPVFVNGTGAADGAVNGVTEEQKAAAEQTLVQVAILIAALVLVSSAASSFRAYIFTLAGERVVLRLRCMLFNSLVVQDVAFFDRTKTGELLSRLSSDATVMQNAVTVNLSQAMRALVSLIGGLIFIFVISWDLTLVMLATLPPIILIAVFYGLWVKKVSKAFQDAIAATSEVASDALTNVRTVRAFGQERQEMSRYASSIDTAYGLAKKRSIGYGVMVGGSSFFANVAIGAILWYGGAQVVTGQLSPGRLSAFVMYALTVGAGVASLTGLYSDFMKSVGASHRVFALIDRRPRVRWTGKRGAQVAAPTADLPRATFYLGGDNGDDLDVADDDADLGRAGLTGDSAGMALARTGAAALVGASPGTVRGEVELRNVHFSYPSRPDVEVLRDVSFKLEPGKVVALVGGSGGGKSTCVALLSQFYYPTKGQVILDGVDARDMDPAVIHRNVAIVSQEPVLFATSIRDNIAYGLARPGEPESVPLEAVVAAAKVAACHDFISAFPDGYDTLVGERGVRLSGGQRQRLAIARAVLMNPRVLLLDEATSALDAESEYLVQQALDRVIRGRTVLVIAHRLSTVRSANNVVVIDGGQVVEQGTHHDLLKRPDGMYRALVKRQLAHADTDRYDDDDDDGDRDTDARPASASAATTATADDDTDDTDLL